MFFRRFVAYILFSHERALQPAKQQNSCVYIHTYIERKRHVCIHMQAHRLFKDKSSPHQVGFQVRVILLIRTAVTVPLQLPPPYTSFFFSVAAITFFN